MPDAIINKHCTDEKKLSALIRSKAAKILPSIIVINNKLQTINNQHFYREKSNSLFSITFSGE